MATVITNMLSAIPWIGQDFVQFTQTHLLTLSAILSLVLLGFVPLPTIGVVNTKSLRGTKARTPESKQNFAGIPYSFLAMFIGLVDGDGYIQIIKTSKGFIALELVISLEIADLPMLQHLHDVLGIGRVNSYPNIWTAKFIIGRVDLQKVLFPLMIHHGLFFLTDTRRAQFERAMFIMQNNITLFANITAHIPVLHPLPFTPAGYLLLPFFLNWIVGFTIAEGSFYFKASG